MARLGTYGLGVLALAGMSAPALARPPAPCAAEATAQNKMRVEAALTGWRNGTASIGDLLADTVRWTVMGNTLVSGTTNSKAELMDKVLAPFNARFSRSADRFRPVAIRGVYGDGDEVIALFDGHGTDNDGHPYDNSYAWFLRFKDGKAVEVTAFFDSVAFNAFWRRGSPAGGPP